MNQTAIKPNKTEWQEVAWPYNSAIQLPCVVKRFSKSSGFSTDVYLHQSFKCVDTEANEGNGAWEQGEGFDFTVKGEFTGRCPDTVKTLEEAKAYVEQYVPTMI